MPVPPAGTRVTGRIVTRNWALFERTSSARTCGGEGGLVIVTIDGSSLTCAQVAAVARQRATVAVAAAAEAAARAARQVAQEVAARQPVYGRTTGVGANHVVPISERDRAEHGFRLLRSHAAGRIAEGEFDVCTGGLRSRVTFMLRRRFVADSLWISGA